MLNLFQIGVVGSINDNCGGLGPIVRIIKKGVFPIVQPRTNQYQNMTLFKDSFGYLYLFIYFKLHMVKHTVSNYPSI